MNNKPRVYRKFHWDWRINLVMLSLLILFISLGKWQLHRETEKKLMMEIYQRASEQPARWFRANLGSDLENKSVVDGEKIKLQGEYLSGHDYLLDNQFSQHQVGYYVLTPFEVGKTLILVNRGWVPRLATREELPLIEAVQGPQTIEGYVSEQSQKTWVLGSAEDNKTWPRVIEVMDLKAIENELQRPVERWFIKLAANQSHGYQRDWSLSWMKPEQHRAYAIQWFIMASLTIVLWIVLARR